jgi:hypothetical protein|tara:strand:- start:21 stop:530 length:510 start_codon:yes stop_codon:yes gene_type:complete
MGKINKSGIIEAEISWPKLFEFNKDTKYKPDGEYSCVATFSEDQKKKLLDTAVPASRIKDLGNGSYQLTFRRPHNKPNWEGWSPQPRVFDHKAAEIRMKAEESAEIGQYIQPWNPQDDGLIGNGTKAKIKYSVYKGDNSLYESITLEAVGVLDLVSFKPEGGSSSGVSF